MNRKLLFALVAVCQLSAKAIHISTHASALPAVHLALWGFSFLAQDVWLLIFVRLLLGQWLPRAGSRLRVLVVVVSTALNFYLINLGIVTTVFFVATGAEIHWRNAAFASDPGSRGVMLSAILSFVMVVCVAFTLAWLLQNVLFGVFGALADVVNFPFACVISRGSSSSPRSDYAEIPQYMDIEGSADELKTASITSDSTSASIEYLLPARIVGSMLSRWGWYIALPKLELVLTRLFRLFIFAILLTQFIFVVLRPDQGSLAFMAWSPAILPFIDFSSSSPVLSSLKAVFGTGIQRTWDDHTALERPFDLSWLPKDRRLPGFEDWYSDSALHYNASSDPMRISNLEHPVLSGIRDRLKDISIRHVVLFKLESTRNDVFPFKKDGLIWRRLENSFPNGQLPSVAYDHLSNLTPVANYVTGDYDDGFEHAQKPKRGGIHFTNAHTSGTYTLKSMVSSHCGISSLLADFNVDYKYHFWQPCLPQILEALNTIDTKEKATDGGFKSFPWRSYFWQSATLQFDNFDKLMTKIGFPEENLIDNEYLRSDAAKFGPVKDEAINYFGLPEDPLEDYIRDALASARENDQRLFISHITATTHHPFNMPQHETYFPVAEGLDLLSHYVNAQGYDDQWLGRVLKMLDDEGAADETLVVVVGDHGISIPENDTPPTYYNPNIGGSHVPLVFSHPKLPPIQVDDAVMSLQILPTILDLLRETNSLSEPDAKAISDLVHNYEGQSLIRPMQKVSAETGQPDWQYSVVNPGGALFVVRDARRPDWRLVVPIISNVEWRFTDLATDPIETDGVEAFDFDTFLQNMERKHGLEAAKWVEEAAFASRWWLEDNSKRWRYGPYAQ